MSMKFLSAFHGSFLHVEDYETIIRKSEFSVNNASSLAKSYLPNRACDAVPRNFGKINPSRCAEPVSVQFICMGIAPHGDGCTPVSILSGPPAPSVSCLVFSWTEATRSRASATVETSSMDFARGFCEFQFHSRDRECRLFLAERHRFRLRSLSNDEAELDR